MGHADPTGFVPRWLDRYAYRAEVREYRQVRVSHYLLGETPQAATTVEHAYPGLQLAVVRVGADGHVPGQAARLELVWRVEDAYEPGFKVSVRLRDRDGVARWTVDPWVGEAWIADRPPRAGDLLYTGLPAVSRPTHSRARTFSSWCCIAPRSGRRAAKAGSPGAPRRSASRSTRSLGPRPPWRRFLDTIRPPAYLVLMLSTTGRPVGPRRQAAALVRRWRAEDKHEPTPARGAPWDGPLVRPGQWAVEPRRSGWGHPGRRGAPPPGHNHRGAVRGQRLGGEPLRDHRDGDRRGTRLPRRRARPTASAVPGPGQLRAQPRGRSPLARRTPLYALRVLPRDRAARQATIPCTFSHTRPTPDRRTAGTARRLLNSRHSSIAPSATMVQPGPAATGDNSAYRTGQARGRVATRVRGTPAPDSASRACRSRWRPARAASSSISVASVQATSRRTAPTLPGHRG